MIFSATEFITQSSQDIHCTPEIFKRYFLYNLEQPILHTFSTRDNAPDSYYEFDKDNHGSI